jgi:hypothetical protein
VIDGTHNVGPKNLSYTTGRVKGSSSFSPPLIIPTPGSANTHWLYLSYTTLTVANFTIYHTYNFSSSYLYNTPSLFYAYSTSSLNVSGVTFITQNPGLLLYGQIFKTYYSASIINITDCVFTNISFQSTPLIYDDWNSTFLITSCSFRYILTNLFLFFFFF